MAAEAPFDLDAALIANEDGTTTEGVVVEEHHSEEHRLAVEIVEESRSEEHQTLKYHLLGPSLTKAGQDSVDQSKASLVYFIHPSTLLPYRPTNETIF